MKALFFTTYTPNNEVFWKSLECTGVEVIPQRYDDRPYERHAEFIDIARNVAPDFIVCVGALDWGPGISNPIPKHPILCRLRDIAPSVLLCGDVADSAWWGTLDEYASHGCFDLVVGMDGCARDGVIPKLTPVDARAYRPLPWNERPIQIGCNGGQGGERGQMIGMLNAVTPGIVPAEAMAAFMCRCKAIVNAPRNGTGNDDHVKGRVVETGFAGACLLERRNAATARWFTPGVDYVEYGSPEDGFHKLQWIINNDAAAAQIAQNLLTKMQAEHHPSIFWGDVIKRLGLGA
jgi:hypothetical protein